MYLPVLAHPGCPGQSPESHKMVVVVVVVSWQFGTEVMPFIASTKFTLCQARLVEMNDHLWVHIPPWYATSQLG